MHDSPAAAVRVGKLTVTRMQCTSLGSPLSSAPTRSARRSMSFTRTTLMSLSKQKAWMSVKWIWRAMSHWYSSSVASTQNATLSGSLWEDERKKGDQISRSVRCFYVKKKKKKKAVHDAGCDTYTFMTLADS